MKERQLSFHERPRFVLYARGHRLPDVYPRIYVPVYENASKARAWLIKFINDDPYEIYGNRVCLDMHTIDCEQLTTVLSAPTTGSVTPEEARAILRFKHGSWDETHEAGTVVQSVTNDAQIAIKPTKQLKRQSKPDDYISIGELCEKWNILPLTARSCLRASGRIKPSYGWSFAPNEIEAIKKICGVK